MFGYLVSYFFPFSFVTRAADRDFFFLFFSFLFLRALYTCVYRAASFFLFFYFPFLFCFVLFCFGLAGTGLSSFLLFSFLSLYIFISLGRAVSRRHAYKYPSRAVAAGWNEK